MKKTTLFIILCLLIVNSIFSQDAGITNPANNVIIYEDNRASFFSNSDWDDMQVDGWLNEGKISQLKVYYKSASSTNFSSRVVSNLNTTTWDREIRVVGGVYEVYLNVKCNYTGCLQAGTDTATRSFTYVRPFEANHMYIAPSNDEHITIQRYIGYGTPNLNTGFYFRTYRNTQPQLTGGSYIGGYTQDEYFTDTTSERGQTYYYWTEVAMDANGSYKSGLLENGYTSVTVATLGVEENQLNKSITITPNPAMNMVKIATNNNVLIKNIAIYDVNGRLLKTIANTFEAISIKEFSKGIYLFNLYTTKGTVSKKIIKK